MRPLGIVLGAVWLGGCESPPVERLLDTGWFDDEADLCAARIETTTPEDGATGWYWRSAPRIFIDQPGDDVTARLTTEGGVEVPSNLVVDGTGLVLDVVFEGGLEPHTPYVLELMDCEGPQSISFTTSAMGTPLVGGVRSLLGRTYELDLVGATWVEPGGFGSFLAANFSIPVLLGVSYADDRFMDWIGAQGDVVVGEIRQDRDEPTWDFPISDFSEAPWFSTSAREIRLDVAGFPLPVVDFELEGTFSADGSYVGGAVLKGLGDTRLAGAAVGQADNPAAVCALAANLGVPCIDCLDGEPLCLQVELRDLEAHEVEGLSLVPVAE